MLLLSSKIEKVKLYKAKMFLLNFPVHLKKKGNGNPRTMLRADTAKVAEENIPSGSLALRNQAL